MTATPLYLDLDGPILDVSSRYYRVHCDLVRALGGEPELTASAHWAKRRAGAGAAALAEAEGIGERARAYLEGFLARIEEDAMLELDALQPGALEALGALASRQPVVLVTLRQNRAGLERELDRLAIRPHLARVLTASPLDDPGERTKERLIRESGLPTDAAWLAGDTEIDLRAARLLGLRAAAITCGIREEAALRREQPDAVFASLTELAAHSSEL